MEKTEHKFWDFLYEEKRKDDDVPSDHVIINQEQEFHQRLFGEIMQNK